jgi:hypothetical protein
MQVVEAIKVQSGPRVEHEKQPLARAAPVAVMSLARTPRLVHDAL